MAYDEATAARVRAAIGRRKVAERKMFGGMAFMYRGHMCCGVLEDRVVLRLGNEGAERALGHIGVTEMVNRAEGKGQKAERSKGAISYRGARVYGGRRRSRDVLEKGA
jgi:TfoX/Sxy family transcriptional regulator of competence genes